MRQLLLVLVSLVFIACQATKHDPQDPNLILIQAESSGVPLNPRTGDFLDCQKRSASMKKAPENYYDDYLDAMFQAADAYNDRVIQAKEGRRPIRRILIYVHGGLNSHSSAAEKARDTASLIKTGEYNGKFFPKSRAYPIYLTWNSAPISTYCENVYPTRRGYYTPVASAISAPGQIAADIGRGIGRFPMTIWRQISTEWQSTLSINRNWLRGYYPSWKHSHQQYLQYSKHKNGPGALELQKGHFFDTSVLTKVKRSTIYITALGLRLVTSPIFLDGFGESAWGIMRRRADNAFVTPKGLEGNSEDKEGAFLIFFKKLKQHMHDEIQEASDAGEPAPKYEITLVGHSMGAIILNKALTLYDGLPIKQEIAKTKTSNSNKEKKTAGENENEKKAATDNYPIKNIVYMGAACSVNEGLSSILPFLSVHKKTNFYNLTLHPICEISEESVGIVARGSLLEWIDNWYDNPATILEHRFGKWNNVMHALHLIKSYEKSITDRFHVKAFGRRDGHVPQGHGEFNDGPFWLKRFWTVGDKKNIGLNQVYEFMHFKPYEVKER